MALRWWTTVVDCHDPAAQARWWSQVLGWQVAYESPDEVVLVPPHALAKRDETPVLERGPGLVFVPVPDDKRVKNRLHIDLAPPAGDDHAAEVERVLALGATRVDVGQADAPWVVLADPEDNEFCILTPRD